MLQDLTRAAKSLFRSCWFSLAAIGMLAVVIGANTAVFSVVEGVLLRPLPYAAAERLCVLWKSVPRRNIEWDWTSAPAIRDWREQGTSFEDIALVLRPDGSRIALMADGLTENVQPSVVSDNFFSLLGVPALLGRTFAVGEPGDAAVLSHRLWQQRYGGRSSVIGESMRIQEGTVARSVTIIGIMPAEFEFPDREAELWLRLTADPRWPAFQRVWLADAFFGLARLKAGVRLEDARREMDAVAGRLAQQHPATDKDLGIQVRSLAHQITLPRIRAMLWTLSGTVLCVLLIGCSNFAGLLFARGTSRGRELAVRAALGASRARLARELLAEPIMLAGLGGIGGVGLAYALLPVLVAMAPAGLPRSAGIAVNGVVLGFSVGLTLVTAVVSGLIPAWQLAGAAGSDTSRGSSETRGVQRLRGFFVAVQFALAILLLSGTGLLVRSFLLLNAVPHGFDTSHLITVQLPPGNRALLLDSVRRVEAIPGVAAAAAGSAVAGTYQGNSPNQHIVVEDRPATPDSSLHARNICGEGYFGVLGIPLIEGRLFQWQDTASTPAVAVVNQRMASRYWPAEGAVGKRFKEVLPGMTAPWITVIGVVPDVHYNRDGVVIPLFYPLDRQHEASDGQLVVRTYGDPRALIEVIRRTVPRAQVAAVEDVLAEQDRPRLFQAQLIGIFALIAVLLAGTGLFALMAYSVSRRTREIGIRIAVGSTGAGIVRLVLRQGLVLGGFGMAGGLAGGVALGHALSASLYGVAPGDPLTMGAVAVFLGGVILVACAVPAVRAARVEPMTALRAE